MKLKTKGEIDYKDDTVYLADSNCTYIQNADGNSDEVQEIHISQEDCGGGKYFVLETKRWCFDEIEDLITVLKDYQKRAE